MTGNPLGAQEACQMVSVDVNTAEQMVTWTATIKKAQIVRSDCEPNINNFHMI